MKKPIIAIFGSNDNGGAYLRCHYYKALVELGCIPTLVFTGQPEENIRYFIDLADGFMFAGGIDVDPMLYGEEKLNDSVSIDPERDASECLALPMILQTKKPIFAICRGMQICNVALGGSLYQDIPAQIPSDIAHRQKENGERDTHGVTIDKNSRLYEIIGSERIMTNSFHHQSVKTVADGFSVSARSDDGIIEAIEDKSHPFFIAVQWHPEYTAEISGPSRALFDAFINACKKSKK